MNTSAVEIFLVEDNPSDVRWMQEVLKEAPMRSRLTVARDGEEAVAFLTQEGGYANAPRPDL
ncbi:MAG: response regulator, partial [Nitrospirae bacterium]